MKRLFATQNSYGADVIFNININGIIDYSEEWIKQYRKDKWLPRPEEEDYELPENEEDKEEERQAFEFIDRIEACTIIKFQLKILDVRIIMNSTDECISIPPLITDIPGWLWLFISESAASLHKEVANMEMPLKEYYNSEYGAFFKDYD